jgi:D-serine deaminase-like pyridoxal phosphate-dependent protein
MNENIADIIDTLGGIDWDQKNRAKKLEKACEALPWVARDSEAFDKYHNIVEDMSNAFDMAVRVIDQTHERDYKLIAGIGDLVNLIPRHVVFDRFKISRKDAEDWLSENAEKDYDIAEILNVIVVGFDSESDWTLFKVRHSV